MTTTKQPDLIVIEIHALRERLAEQCQNDLLAYSHAADEHCRKLGFRVVESPRIQRGLGEVVKVE